MYQELGDFDLYRIGRYSLYRMKLKKRLCVIYFDLSFPLQILYHASVSSILHLREYYSHAILALNKSVAIG